MSGRTILVLGAGATGISEVDGAPARDRWDVVERVFRGGRGILGGAETIEGIRARPDAWAVVIEERRFLLDELDENTAVELWDFLPATPPRGVAGQPLLAGRP